MEIKKGYTLSQFVDKIEIDNFGTGNNDLPESCIPDFKIRNLIFAYNDFLKQPPKKEQFVNEIEVPMLGVHDPKAWKEAEKKVIFEGWKQDSVHPNVVCKESYRRYETITFYESGTQYNIEDNGNDMYYDADKLGDLFQATNGELKLKNVTL